MEHPRPVQRRRLGERPRHRAAGNNRAGQLNVHAWQDVVQVAAGYQHSLGLTADGRVIAAGAKASGVREVTAWDSIAQVAAGSHHSVGLARTGTVAAAGSNAYGQCNTQE